MIAEQEAHRHNGRTEGEWYPAEDYHQDYWAGKGSEILTASPYPAQIAEAQEKLPGASQERRRAGLERRCALQAVVDRFSEALVRDRS